MSTPEKIIKTDDIWYKDISRLYSVDRITEFFPNRLQTQEERLNSIARLGIYIGILLSAYKRDYRQMVWGLIGLFITFIVYKNHTIKENLEQEIKQKPQKVPKPTLNNPFMNPSIVDILDNPKKLAAPNYSEDTVEAEKIRQQIEEKYDYNLYKSIDDVYNKSNGQRQFYTVPNTEIPSNQEKFLDFLYSDMKKNCKTDSTVCEPFNDLRSNPFIFPDPKENPVVSS